MNELLINFYCPSTSKHYDFWISETITVEKVINQICDDICSFENKQDVFQNRQTLILCSYLNKKVLPMDFTIAQAGIRSGDRLALV